MPVRVNVKKCAGTGLYTPTYLPTYMPVLCSPIYITTWNRDCVYIIVKPNKRRECWFSANGFGKLSPVDVLTRPAIPVHQWISCQSVPQCLPRPLPSTAVITGYTQQNLFDQIHQMSFGCQTRNTPPPVNHPSNFTLSTVECKHICWL